MARNPTRILTDRESQIMDVLWRLESATAEQVRQELPDELHDSSVRTLLRVLIEKGHVEIDPSTRPKIYRPTVSKTSAQQKATSSLLDRFFQGSAESLVMRLLEDEKLTFDQVEELRRTLAQSKKRPVKKAKK